MKKAFDCAGKEQILAKLSHYGVDDNSIKWFNSYLSNRRQYSIVNNVASDTSNLSECMAQGSILAPELFLCLINDLHRSLRYSKCVLFADDTIYIVGRNLKFLKAKLQYDLDELSNWMCCNELRLNVAKTKLIIFCKLPIYYDKLIFQLLNEPIDIVNTFKFLGINYSNDLDFTGHTNILTNKLRFYNYKLKNSLKFLSDHCKKIFFHAFVSSQINYGTLIWYPLTPQRITNKLDSVYNKMVTTCRIDALSISEICKIQMLCFNYDYEHNNLPDGITLDYVKRSETHKYNTRNKNQPCITKHLSLKYNKSFIVKGCIMWQKLPHACKQSTTKKKFKKYLMVICDWFMLKIS